LAVIFVCQVIPFGYATDALGLMWEKTFGGIYEDIGVSSISS